MKKLTAILISAIMTLTSCLNTSAPEASHSGESTAYPAQGNSVSTYGFDLDNLNYNPTPGITDSTLRKAGEISPLVMENWANAPEVCMAGESTYIMRSYPREITTEEEYNAFRSSGKRLCEIEVYENHDYSEPVRTIPLTGLDETHFAVWAFSYNPDDGCFYLLLNISEDGTWENVHNLFLYRFSSDGEYIADSKLENAAVAKYHINKGKVYFVANGGWSGRAGKLICEDPFAGTTEVIHDSVMTLSFSDYVMYYVRVWRINGEGFDAAIFTLDPETGEEIQLARIQPENAELDGEIHIHGACWDDANDTLYISFGRGLLAVKDGRTRNVISAYDIPVIPVTATDRYLLVEGRNSLSTVYYTEADPETIAENNLVLNVCYYAPGFTDTVNEDNASWWFKETVDIMNAAGMAVSFNFTYITDNIDEYINTMAKKLLAGDTDYDLFYVSDETPTLIQSQYFEDLGNYNVLADRFDHMIPGLRELMSVGGKNALVPINTVRVTGLRFRSSVLGTDYDFPENYDDFFRFHDVIVNDLPEEMYYIGYSSPFMVMSEWLYEIYSNFMARTVSDETAESDLLKLFTDMTALDSYEGILSTKEEYAEKKNWKPAVEFANNNGESHSGYFAAFPKMGEDYKNSIRFIAVGMNPNSPNRELAAAYLAYHMKALDDGSYLNLLFEDTAENYAASRHEESLRQNRYQSFREQIADGIRLTYNDDFRALCWDLSKKVESGETSPEEAAAEAFRFMKMARDE